MLDNIEDIKNWILKYTDLDESNFKINHKTLVVDTLCDTYVRFQDNIIPIKFGIIDGDFAISSHTLKKDLLETNPINLDFLPTHIYGNLIMADLPLEQKLFNDWNIQVIEGYINLCSKNSNLTNLNFLENTEFDFLNLKITNTPFKDDIIPEEMKIYNEKNNWKITKKELIKIIVNDNILLDYFDFNIENKKEIK